MEHKLIQDAQGGDEDAFRELVHQNLPNVLALGIKMLGNSAEAEDMSQEVMLSLWQNIKKYDASRGKLSTWLYRITANRCLDRLRRKKIDQLPEDFDAPVDADQDLTVYNKQLGILVESSLSKLPERQHMALVLFHYQGHSLQEIADIMDCSSEAIESLLARARRSLKKSFSPIWKKLNEDNFEGEL